MYYQYGLEEDKDGYIAAHAMGNYMVDINVDYNALSPLWIYMGTPTYNNAVKLLRSQNVHIPLSALRSYLVQQRPSAITRRGRGGMEDTEYTRVLKKRRIEKASVTKLKTLIGLDTLKDIHPVECEALWNMVNFDVKPLKGLDEAAYRYQSAKALEQYLNVSFKTNIISKSTESMAVHIEKDTLMWRQMMKWMSASQTELFIVLDGFVNAPDLSSFLKSIMIHALFQALLYNAHKLGTYISSMSQSVMIDPLPYTIQTITILDGRFQKNDGIILTPFYQKYIQSLCRQIPHLQNVVMKRVDDDAELFEKYFVKDPTGKHWASKRPTHKKDLQQKYQKLKDANKIEDMAIRNFVRDAWKADIAIKYNAVFITCDHNAMTYHRWISKQEIVERNAVALFLNDDAFVVKA